MTRLLCVGDNVVDVYVDESVMFPGGNALNVAVHATRLGTPTGYVGVVGDDAAGALVLSSLRMEGVDDSLTRVKAGTNAFATVHLAAGERIFGDTSVGVSQFTLSEADLAAASAADLVHTGECSMLESQLPVLAQRSRRLSFDFSERPRDYVSAYAPYVDVAFLSRPSTDLGAAEDTARAVLDLGVSQVVVTRGASGALWTDGNEWVHATAPTIEPLDTLGAGDALIGRVLAGLIAGQLPADFLSAATSYATATCSQRGAFGYATPFTETQYQTTPRERHQP